MVKYATHDYSKEHMARASGRNLTISEKQAIEVCAFLRGMDLQRGKAYLEDVIELKKAIPFKRFTNGLGHRSGMASGRYPIKASTAILSLLNSVEANAQEKGLNTSTLVIKHICANKASAPFRGHKKRRNQAKRSHVEVIVEEIGAKKEDKKEAKPASEKKKAKEAKETKAKKETPAKEMKDMKDAVPAKENKQGAD